MDIAFLEKLDLKTLEKVCRVLFDQMGFTAKSTATGSMPGIGEVMVLHSKSSNAPFALLQCAEVGARVELIQLAQVKNSMAKLALNNGYLITVGTTGPAAHDFAAANKINLVDGAKLVGLMNNLPETGRHLLQQALAPEQVAKPAAIIPHGHSPKPPEPGGPPVCAKCGATMKLQIKHDGIYQTGKFWQCPTADCGYISAYHEQQD